MGKNGVLVITWAARALAVAVLGVGLTFYFGYNVMPFSNPLYTLMDNVWLIVFPIMFIGLALGLLFQKVGGYLVTVPIVIALILGLILQNEFVGIMLVPLVVGVLYLFVGYSGKRLRQT